MPSKALLAALLLAGCATSTAGMENAQYHADMCEHEHARVAESARRMYFEGSPHAQAEQERADRIGADCVAWRAHVRSEENQYTASRERRARMGSAFRRQQPVSCTSQRFGSTVSTTCN